MQAKTIYGCDFSGAINPSEKIFIARGELVEGNLQIEEVIHCEERLDLYTHITSKKAYWGMDMPFAYPAFVYQNMEELENLASLYEFALRTSRTGFKDQIERSISLISPTPTRLTDAAVNAKSPISKTPINMLGLTYGGFKLMANLVRRGVNVYPFSEQNSEHSCIYEVYPSHTWNTLKLKRGTPISTLLVAFHDKYPLQVVIKDTVMSFIDSLKPSMQMDANDAVVACMTMAYAMEKNRLNSSWRVKPAFASDEEWRASGIEGLIVRLS